jgi:Flp pilus assembly pilin Flp
MPGRNGTPTGSSAPARTAKRRLEAAARSVVAALMKGQAGQSMVEYAIVLFLVAVVAMVAVRALGQGVDEVFRSILESFRTVLPQGGGS